MSFSYTQIDNPAGSGPFTFTPSYTNASDVAVMGYNGKVWSELKVASVDAQTVTLESAVDTYLAIRISNNAVKIASANTNRSHGNVITSIDNAPDNLEIAVEDPQDRTGASPMTAQGITIGGIKKSVLEETGSGYEFTGGFTDRTTGQSGANDLGSNTQYTAQMATDQSWYRFGFDRTRQVANDTAYFPITDPDIFDQTKGLFGGQHMPDGITNLIDFDFDDAGDTGSYSDAVTTGGLKYNAATGSYDLTQCDVGDLVKVRFSFNAVPQVANSTLEVGLIFMTRGADDQPTFTFALTTQPVFYGTGSQGVAYLNRVEMSAYIASDEDRNARLLPAIRCNNEILIQPLTSLISIIR